MKVLIGTPIHESKDYCMEKWLDNVAQLMRKNPSRLLLVDTSPDLSYLEKIKNYCDEVGIKDYKLRHLEIGPWQPWAEKTGRSWELIRQEVIANGYDVWFSWECDLIIPINTLDILSSIIKSGNYSMVHTNVWSKTVNPNPEANFGCCLIKRDVLEKYTFILTPPENCWAGGEERFKKKVLEVGGSFLELYGTISPISRLTEKI